MNRVSYSTSGQNGVREIIFDDGATAEMLFEVARQFRSQGFRQVEVFTSEGVPLPAPVSVEWTRAGPSGTFEPIGFNAENFEACLAALRDKRWADASGLLKHAFRFESRFEGSEFWNLLSAAMQGHGNFSRDHLRVIQRIREIAALANESGPNLNAMGEALHNFVWEASPEGTAFYQDISNALAWAHDAQRQVQEVKARNKTLAGSLTKSNKLAEENRIAMESAKLDASAKASRIAQLEQEVERAHKQIASLKAELEAQSDPDI